MPGYHDEVEADDVAEDETIEGEETQGHRPPSSTRSKPRSTRPPNSGNAGGSRPKPSSTASTSAAPPKPGSKASKDGDGASPAPLLECPICGKLLETDNQGLNEHIDFCLSKGAIKEAQASSLNSKPGASGSVSESGPSRKGHKPPSRKQKDKGGGHGEGLLRFRKLDPS